MAADGEHAEACTPAAVTGSDSAKAAGELSRAKPPAQRNHAAAISESNELDACGRGQERARSDPSPNGYAGGKARPQPSRSTPARSRATINHQERAMSRYYTPPTDSRGEGDIHFGRIAFDIAAGATLVVALLMGGCPRYKVWSQEMEGRAELRRAEQNRQITIQEARAKLESAKALADAEIVRAKGAAEANRIIADGMGGPEGYLRYLWIQEVAGKDGVIYVPTEAGLPILEAGKRAEIVPAE